MQAALSSIARRINWDAVTLSSFFLATGVTLLHASNSSEIEDAVPCGAYSPDGSPSHSTKISSAGITKALGESRFRVSKKDMETLNKDGLLVITNVFTSERLLEMRKAVDDIHTEGRMKVTSNDASVRQDLVCWVRPSDGRKESRDGKEEVRCDPDHSDEGEKPLRPLPACLIEAIYLLREVAITLEQAGYERSQNHMVPQQCQLARYDGNMEARYMAHRDAMDTSLATFLASGLVGWLKTSDYRKRCITAILYLNKSDWNSAAGEDGGALCCYMGADCSDDSGTTATSVIRINPAGGTLVLFDSNDILHAVEPSSSCRYALTLWITGEKINRKNNPAI